MRPASLTALALLGSVLAVGALGPVNKPTARDLVDRARRAHGVAALDDRCVVFGFRGATYAAVRAGGRFAYRLYPGPGTAAAPIVRLTNDGLALDPARYEAWRRRRDGLPALDAAALADSARARGARNARSAETALNSVVYFALLPHALADPAVRLRRLPDASLDGQTVHTVEATFVPQGGGRDHDDRFVYWLSPATGRIVALAYRFHTGEGGTRFRHVTAEHAVSTGEGRRPLVLLDHAAFTDTTLADRIEAFPERLGAPTLRRLPDIAFDRTAEGRVATDHGPAKAAASAEGCALGATPRDPAPAG